MQQSFHHLKIAFPILNLLLQSMLPISMPKKIIAVSSLLISVIVFSFFTDKKPVPAQLVKNYYLAQTQLFINDLQNFKKSISEQQNRYYVIKHLN